MPPIKALIADDENITRFVLRTLLREQNIDVLGEAANGMDTLDLCNKLHPDVLFLDINMPKMDGFEVLKNIRLANSELVIIMISSNATISNVEEAKSYGVNGFIVKPFNPAQVMDAIARSFN